MSFNSFGSICLRILSEDNRPPYGCRVPLWKLPCDVGWTSAQCRPRMSFRLDLSLVVGYTYVPIHSMSMYRLFYVIEYVKQLCYMLNSFYCIENSLMYLYVLSTECILNQSTGPYCKTACIFCITCIVLNS